FLGKFSVIRDPHSASLMAVRDVPGPEVQMLSLKAEGSDQVQSTESTSRMELSAYLRMVRKKVTLNRAESRQYETRYYSGQDMLVQPPDFQDIARRAGPEPQFHLFYNARWFEPDSGTPINFLVNPDGAPSAQISDDISAALTAWSTVPGCSLRMVN